MACSSASATRLYPIRSEPSSSRGRAFDPEGVWWLWTLDYPTIDLDDSWARSPSSIYGSPPAIPTPTHGMISRAIGQSRLSASYSGSTLFAPSPNRLEATGSAEGLVSGSFRHFRGRLARARVGDRPRWDNPAVGRWIPVLGRAGA